MAGCVTSSTCCTRWIDKIVTPRLSSQDASMMFDKVASIVIQLLIQLSFLFETKQIQVFIPQFPVLMKPLSTCIIRVTSNSLACILLRVLHIFVFCHEELQLTSGSTSGDPPTLDHITGTRPQIPAKQVIQCLLFRLYHHAS